MRISKITMGGFTAFEKPTTLTLPETGVVLLTGPNGAGKSSLADAVSMALWGEAVRPASPWRAEGGAVVVESDSLSITRSRKKLKTQLSWQPLGKAPVANQYDSAAKAQDALNAALPITKSLWQRTHVFRSFDLGALSRTDDASRKRLLEALLGLGGFDTALEKIRAKIRGTEQSLQTTGYRVSLYTERDSVAAMYAAIEDYTRSSVDTQAKAIELQSRIVVVENAVKEAREREEIHSVLVTQIEFNIGVKDQYMNALSQRERGMQGVTGACSSCTQPVTKEAKQAILSSIASDKTSVSADLTTQVSKLEEARATRAILLRESSRLTAILNELKSELRDLNAHDGVRQSYLRRIEEEEKRAYMAVFDRASQLHGLRQLEAHVSTFKALEQVFGLQGVRAHLIDSALVTLTNEANRWLSLLCHDSKPITVELAPTSKVTAGTRDKISLSVYGVGEGYGYPACSDGEQRRIDLALMFSLAALAGDWQGTLFVDECFDGLHESGVQAAIDAIREVARTRCVVLTTHRSDVARELRDAVHYKFIAPGEIEQQ